MPLITIKVFESELTKDQAAEMIQDITEAVIPYVGGGLRSNTWVLVEEVKSGSCGIGGRALGLPDLRQIQESAPPDQRPIRAGHEHKRFEEQSRGQR